VYDRSGEWCSVCVERSSFACSSTWVQLSVTLRGRSSSLRASQSLSLCVAWEVVVGWYWTPRCTRSTRRGGVLPSGDSNAGERQKGEVSLLTRMSQVANRSLGGLVSLGGVSSRGISFHSRGSGDLGLSLVGETW